MTKSQELQIRLAALRSEINNPDNGFTEDQQVAKRREVSDLDGQFARALEQENGEVAGATFSQESAEYREQMEVTRRADLGVMVGNFMGRQNQDGAEREAQQAWGLNGAQIPMGMLAEIRIVAAPASGGGTQPVSAYVFGNSIAQAANIVRPAIAAGTPVYPSVSVAAVAGRPAEGAAHGSSEPTIRGQLLEPKSIQAVASLSVEDRARYPTLGAAISQHLAAAVVRGMDTQALIDNNGFFDATNGPLTAPGDPGSATTYAQALAMLTAGVDGDRAADLSQAGLIIGSETFADFMALSGINSDESVMERMMRIGRVIVSGAIPVAASSIQNALTIKGIAPAAVQAVWPGLTLEDPYTDKATRTIGFSVTGLAAFSVQHPAGYAWQKANVS